MKKLKEIIAVCKGSVTIMVNDHKDSYITIQDAINELEQYEIDSDIAKQIIEKDSLIRMQCYPHTPVGFFAVFHYDIDLCINAMYEVFVNEGIIKKPYRGTI